MEDFFVAQHKENVADLSSPVPVGPVNLEVSCRILIRGELLKQCLVRSLQYNSRRPDPEGIGNKESSPKLKFCYRELISHIKHNMSSNCKHV
jgi:hypothetical protein